jgi:hypothetical protein
MVEVARRKMPGINKDGGAARVTKVNDESTLDKKMTDGSANGKKTTPFTYNVKYMLGGNERRVDARWIVSKDPEATSRDDLKKERQDSQQARQAAAAAAAAAAALKEQQEKEARAAKRAAARDTSMLELQKRRKAIKEKQAAAKAAAKAAAAAAPKKKASTSAEKKRKSSAGSSMQEVEDAAVEEYAEPIKKPKVVNPRLEEIQVQTPSCMGRVMRLHCRTCLQTAFQRSFEKLRDSKRSSPIFTPACTLIRCTHSSFLSSSWSVLLFLSALHKRIHPAPQGRGAVGGPEGGAE